MFSSCAFRRHNGIPVENVVYIYAWFGALLWVATLAFDQFDRHSIIVFINVSGLLKIVKLY